MGHSTNTVGAVCTAGIAADTADAIHTTGAVTVAPASAATSWSCSWSGCWSMPVAKHHQLILVGSNCQVRIGRIGRTPASFRNLFDAYLSADRESYDTTFARLVGESLVITPVVVTVDIILELPV